MKKYSGITLIETIVTIGIMTFIMLGFTLMLLRVWTVNSFTFETGVATRIADQGLRGVIKEIRKATTGEDGSYPVESATDYEFVFYSDYDSDDTVERLRYFVDGTTEEFKLGVTEPSGNPAAYDPGNDEVVTNVASFIVNNGAGEQAFVYYDNNNNILSPVIISEITLVEVLLYVNVDQIKAPNNVRIQSRSVIRNLSDFGEAPS